MADEAVPDLQSQVNSASQAPESTGSTQQPASNSVAARASELTSTLQSNETGAPAGGEGQVQAEPSFFEQLAELGDDFKGLTDPQEAQKRLLDHARALRKQHQDLQAWQQRANPYVHYGRQYEALSRSPAFQQFLAQQQVQGQQPVQQPQQQAPQQPQKWWNPPAFDRNSAKRYLQKLKDETTGEEVVRWRDDTPLEVRQGFEALRAYEEEWQEKLVNRPHEIFPQIIQQEVVPLIEQALAERERQQNVRLFASDVNARNAPWLYQHDAQGNPLVDPVTREPLFTEAGQRARNYVRWLEAECGVTDPQKRWFIATTMLQNDVNAVAQQTPPQPTAQQIAEEKKKAALAAGRGGNHIPQRNGSTAHSADKKHPPQNGRLSAGKSLRDELERQGLAGLSIPELLNHA